MQERADFLVCAIYASALVSCFKKIHALIPKTRVKTGAAQAEAAAAAAKLEVKTFMQNVEMGHEQLAEAQQASNQLDWNW